MAEKPPGPKPGLVLRLIGGIIGYSIVFGSLWPLGMWILGDSKGFRADLRDGLLNGALVGILMTFLGDPLARWLDRLLARMKGRHGLGQREPPTG